MRGCIIRYFPTCTVRFGPSACGLSQNGADEPFAVALAPPRADGATSEVHVQLCRPGAVT